MSDSDATLELTVLMPCLNEAETLETCIRKAASCIEQNGLQAEILIADNGSTDGSQDIARAAGARVVDVPVAGYGAALLAGIADARGRFVIMGDSDDSYDFTALMVFVEKLREGHELVMGNRFKGGIAPGAMPPLHYYLGNPVLTGIGRLFFGNPAGDFHCGLRGFEKAAIDSLDLKTTGMEFASEMVVKATLHGLKIVEVPTTLKPDGRSRPPHLNSWRDGWRHLRFLLMYSPRWLFLYPGIALIIAGTLSGLWLFPAPRTVGPVTLDVHTLLYSSFAVICGYQGVLFAVFTKTYGIVTGMLPRDSRMVTLWDYLTLEVGLLASALMLASGTGGTLWALFRWSDASFGELDPSDTLRIVIPSTLLLALGVQTGFSSFFLSLMGMAHSPRSSVSTK